MALIRKHVKDLAYSALEDSDLTNADRKTIERYTAALADQLEQVCAQFLAAAIQDAEPQDICQNCAAPSDDGLTEVCIHAAEPMDRSFPGSPAVTEHWCPVCVRHISHLGIVRDEDPEPDPDRERDL